MTERVNPTAEQVRPYKHNRAPAPNRRAEFIRPPCPSLVEQVRPHKHNRAPHRRAEFIRPANHTYATLGPNSHNHTASHQG